MATTSKALVGRLTRRQQSPALQRRLLAVGIAAFAVVGLGVSQFIAHQIKTDGLKTAEFHAKFVEEAIVGQAIQSGGLDRPMEGAELQSFDQLVQNQVLRSGVVHLGIWNRTGELVYSSDPDVRLDQPTDHEGIQRTLAGETHSAFATLQARDAQGQDPSELFRTLVPITPVGGVRPEGVAVFFQLSEPITARIQQAQLLVLAVVFGALGLLFVGLYPLLRRHAGILLHQNDELGRRTDQLERGSIQTIQMLNRLANAKDPYTGGHIGRVAELAHAVGRKLGLEDRDMRALELAAEFHDIGKVAIPDAILNKPGRLTAEERVDIENHPAIGVGILEGSELFRDALPGILHHHERFDGSGYPARLAGRGIPLIARIITAVDAYDAMISDRPYRKALSEDETWRQLYDGAGSQFCPETVAALAEVTGANQKVWQEPGDQLAFDPHHA